MHTPYSEHILSVFSVLRYTVYTDSRLLLYSTTFSAGSHETSSTGAPANPPGTPEVPAAGPAAPRAGESGLEYLHGTSYSECLYTVNSSIIGNGSCT